MDGCVIDSLYEVVYFVADRDQWVKNCIYAVADVVVVSENVVLLRGVKAKRGRVTRRGGRCERALAGLGGQSQ